MSVPTQPLVQEIPVDRIRPSQFPLRLLDEAKVTEIAASMQQQGQLSPILVRPIDNGYYELVYGGHRLDAARRLNWTAIRCEIRSLTTEQAFFAAWSENTARNEFVDPVAEGRGFDVLTHQGYTQTTIAREIGRPQQYVSGRMSLLRLESDVQALITRGLVPAEHGIELSRLDARTSRILAQLCRRDSQNSLRLEELRDLARLAWDQLANDPRVEPLLANDPIEQIRRFQLRFQQLETRIQNVERWAAQVQVDSNLIREQLARIEIDVNENFVAIEGITGKVGRR